MTEAAELLVSVYRNTLPRIRGDRLVELACQMDGNRLNLLDLPLRLSAFQRIFLAGSGKASAQMALGLADLLGDRISGGLIVTKTGYGETIPGVEVIESSHPVPDEASIRAGEQMLAFAAECRYGDLVLYCLSGGSSSLLEAPIEELTLGNLQTLSRSLLASGATIEQMNAVRSRLSRVKAGGLARAFAPAAVAVLVLSDVQGDDISTIGSGPFYQGVGRDPIGVLRHSGIAESLDFPIFEMIRRSQGTEPKVAAVPHRVIGNNETAIKEVVREAKRQGIAADDPDLTFVTGEARDVGPELFTQFEELELSFDVRGGEPTVTLQGDGRGGRGQEMAVAVAPLISGRPGYAFLAAGTDGADGPTDVAGAVVDSESDAIARTAGITSELALAKSDSQGYLSVCDGLLRTGPTGSNVNDLMMMIRLP